MTMRTTAVLIGLYFTLAAASALAQGSPFVAVAGTVEKVEDGAVAVKTGDGAVETVRLSPSAVVSLDQEAVQPWGPPL